MTGKGGIKARLERQVELFNEAVRTGDYQPLLATFAATAVLRFDYLGLAPVRGVAEIGRAYENWLVRDTIALIDMRLLGSTGVAATFEWDTGGTGELLLRWEGAELIEMAFGSTGEPVGR